MKVELEKGTGERVKKVSIELGVSDEDVVDRAILLYLDNISKYLDLKREMSEWDALSDEALLNFEKSL